MKRSDAQMVADVRDLGSYKSTDDASEVAQLISLYVIATKNWELTAKDHSHLLDVPLANWRRMKRGVFKGRLSQDKVMRIKTVAAIFIALRRVGLSHGWLKANNAVAEFRGESPLQRIEKGGILELQRILGYLSLMLKEERL